MHSTSDSPERKKQKLEQQQESVGSSATNVPVATPTSTTWSKARLYSFMQNLSLTSMGDDVLVNIVIDDLQDNKVIIVGRPKLLGSTSRQMRHVTLYSYYSRGCQINDCGGG
jgi:hypothetical protein